MNAVDITVVIGYKDWGMRRLVGAVRSLRSSLAELRSEIIVSDYGSEESTGYREAMEAEGAIYVRTDTNGVWSRSRALNAGLQVGTGAFLVTTDADMVFSPGTFPLVLERFRSDPDQYMIMQCNDLPEGIDHAQIESGAYSWDELKRISTLRPRWGMGGMIAVPRSAYIAARGLDERMEIYGGEDIDFARRMRRLGLKLHWLDDSAAQMYHVWHPSSRETANQSAAGVRAINRNRHIQLNDHTASRNLTRWQFAPATRDPLVSVVISTHNRAQQLRYAILSTLAQTVGDLELIVVDDGSTDETEAVVAAFDDDRIRYFRRANSGLAAARNFATTVARGRFVAVMDDDDVMLPRRLEHSLNAIKDGANGSYGGWVDFDDATGARHFRTGKSLSLQSLLFNNSTYLHPTLLIERRWMLAVPYDEALRSGSDFNMALRLARSGVRLRHSGEYLLLRRNHPGQITATDSSIQKSAGAISAFWGRAGMLDGDAKVAREDRATKDKVSVVAQKNTEPAILEYLPDNTVHRRARVRVRGSASAASDEILARFDRLARLTTTAGAVIFADYLLGSASLEELLILRADQALDIKVETEVLDPSARMTIANPVVLDEMDYDPFAPEFLRELAAWASELQLLIDEAPFVVAVGPEDAVEDLATLHEGAFKLKWEHSQDVAIVVIPEGKMVSRLDAVRRIGQTMPSDVRSARVSNWGMSS